ncbi:MAG: D-2-hydroxyacid dehydrogenase [Gammaproteobacteria bacterium]|nr:D-2-hydroxyacid dehydrogenase [Gammaproteobacteria bacterium]
MTRIVFLDRATIGPSVTITRPAFDHEWVEHEKTSADEVVEKLAEADISITNKVPIRQESLEQLPNLKMISIAATGYDVIDIAACVARGIIVSNVRGYAIHTVPEHTFSIILALQRSIIGYRQDVMNGEWERSAQFCFFSHPIRELAGSTLGIFGEGVLGQAVARVGRAFGMETLFAAHKGIEGLGPLYTPFNEVLERADVISLHAPLTPGTRNMLAMPEFRKMKRRPLIVNAARGGLVDEGDLVTALEEGLISGIGFDVLSAEPPRPDNPLLRVLDRPDVIVTPHVAWASDEAMQVLWNQVIEHIENYVSGSPSNVVS